jgi:type 1 glutamine amidotransferase
MRRHVLLSGGPAHPFTTTSSMLAGLLTEVGFDTEVVTEPADLVTALHAAEAGTGQTVDLVTVNALRWRMLEERFAAERAEHAVSLDPADLDVVARYVRDGGGLLALHTAVICFDGDPTWHELCGASWRWGRSSHPPLGPVRVEITDAGRDHAVTAGLEPFVIEDEAYGFLDQSDDLDPLLTTTHEGRRHPLLWARSVGDGRVATDLLGHGAASFGHPTHRIILSRVAAWAAGRDGARTDIGSTTT